MKASPFVFLLLLIVCPNWAGAQQLHFVNMDNVLNLPSSECYNIMQDSRGYIWISTENGLCRYNGNTIKVYDKNNGLPEGGTYDVMEDKIGTLWMLTSTKRILKLRDGIIEEPAFSKKFTASLKSNPEIVHSFSFDDNNDWIVTSENATYKINHHKGSIRNLRTNPPYQSEANFILIAQHGKDYFIRNKSIDGIFSAKNDYVVRVDLITDNRVTPIYIPMGKSINPDFRVKFCTIGSSRFFSINNNLIRIDKDYNCTITKLPGNILSLSKDGENGLWVGLFQKGLYYYKNSTNLSSSVHALPEYSVSGIASDREGGIWCTSLEKGVFYCNNKAVTDYTNIPELRKKTTLLKEMGGAVYASSGHEGYFILKKDSIAYHKLNLKNTDFVDIVSTKNVVYLANKGYLAQLDSHFGFQKTIKAFEKPYDISTNQLAAFKDKVYVLRPTIFSEIQNGKLPMGYADRIRKRCMLVYNDSIMLVGSNTGLYQYSIPQKNDFISIPGTTAIVTKIIRTSNNKILVATRGDGLLVLEHGRLKPLMDNLKINKALIADMVEDINGILWIATSTGLFKLSKSYEAVYQINTSNGLLSNSVNQLAICNHTLYISSIEGLCSIPIDKNFFNSTSPQIYLSGLTVNGRNALKESDWVFPHDKNAISVTFDVPAFKNGSGTKLLYRLNRNPFQPSNQNRLQFDNLQPDTYTLTVYAVNNDGVKSRKPILLKFEIKKPFWQTAWFILFCFLLLTACILLVSNRRIRMVREREVQKTNMNRLVSESQLSALQAQMNPHFIFNAINSIQSYILKNKEEEAYEYLGKFSRLIRMVLNNSRDNILSLDRELQTLRLYIELEQLRFKDSFEFVLQLDETLDLQETFIPSMLIQPYIENAIWHGLMHLNGERKGLLAIGIFRKLALMEVTITDNGIGRERAANYKKDDVHQPVAMKITDQRLAIIKSIHGYEDTQVGVADVCNAAGEIVGTKVTLYLPLNF